MLGERVSHYRIQERLGAGGMGEVFVGFDEDLHRPVAIKAIRRERRLDELARQRLLREARILSSLDHPGVCRIYDYVQAPAGDFLVLELIRGRSLSDVIRERPARAQALGIAEELANVLAAAHEAGVIHRDLKPGNVMLTPEGAVKVLDFGLSRSNAQALEPEPARPASGPASAVAAPSSSSSRSAHEPGLTTEGTIMGTLQYMSPEQARGEPVTAATDLFALGLILQELFTGEAAHPDGLELHALHRRVMEGTVTLSPRLDRDFAPLVRRLARPEPERRPRAAEVLERIRWIRARPRRVLQRTVAVSAVTLAGLGLLKYTLDLRYERGVAQGRAKQAEELLDLMIGDIRDEFKKAGNTELMLAVGRKYLDYFTRVPRDELSDQEIARNCQAVYDIGSTLLDMGDTPGAMDFFARALGFAREHHARNPANDEWLWQLGQSQFYVGQAHFVNLDHERTRASWNDYLATARELVARAPGLARYRRELAYALMNLASLASAEGRFREAQSSFAEPLEIWRDLARLEPEDPEWRVELADALSWLGSCQERAFELGLAIGTFREEADLRTALRNEDPQNIPLEHFRVLGKHHLAGALRQAGELASALVEQEQAIAIQRTLRERDARNADWSRELAVFLHGLAETHLSLGRVADAERAVEEGSALFDELERLDPTNAEVLLQRAFGQRLRGEVALATGRIPDARSAAADALAFARDASPPLEVFVEARIRAEAALIRGLAARAQGDEGGAAAAWSEGLSALELVPGEARSPHVATLGAHLLARAGRTEEARAARAELASHGFRDEPLDRLLASLSE